MTQQSWNQFDNQYQDAQKQEYAKRAASQLPYMAGNNHQPTMGSWLNTVMPEKINELHEQGQYNPAQSVLNTSYQNQQNLNQGLDVHSLHQRVDDLSHTIARMEKSVPSSNTYAQNFLGQNRRNEMPVPYAGQMRRSDEIMYGNRQAQQNILSNSDMVNHLVVRLEDAERHAREAWRVAQTAQNLVTVQPKVNSDNAIARAEKILAAADETARKTLALLNAKQNQEQTSAPVYNNIAQSKTCKTAEIIQKEDAMQSLMKQMSELSEKIQSLSTLNSQTPKEIIKEVIVERALENNNGMELLLSQIQMMSDKLQLVSSEINELKTKPNSQDLSEDTQSLSRQINEISQKINLLTEVKADEPKETIREIIVERVSDNDSDMETLLSEIQYMSDKLQFVSSEINELKTKPNSQDLSEDTQSLSRQINEISQKINLLTEVKADEPKETIREIIVEKAADNSILFNNLNTHIIDMSEKLQSIAHEIDDLKLKPNEMQATLDETNSLAQQMNCLAQKVQNLVDFNSQNPKEVLKEVIVERVLENTIIADELLSQIESMSEKLQLISSEIVEFKSKPKDTQALEFAQLTAMKNSIESNSQIETIKEQIHNLAKEIANNRMEDNIILERLSKTIQIANLEESQTREKILQELNSVKLQDAIVSNEVEDISEKLEQQIGDLKFHLLQPQNYSPVLNAIEDIKTVISSNTDLEPLLGAIEDIKSIIGNPLQDVPVMEALQDIFSKIEGLEINSNDQFETDIKENLIILQNQIREIQSVSAHDDTAIIQQINLLDSKIEALYNAIQAKSVDKTDESFIIEQLEQHLNSIRNSMLSTAQYQDLNANISEIRTVIHSLDQRFFMLSDAVEIAANQLKSQNISHHAHTQDGQDLTVVINKINQLQEQLVDAPVKMGIASMEYQLHQLDKKIEDMGESGEDAAQATKIHEEIQTLKTIIENNNNSKSFSKLERDIEDLQILIENNNSVTSSRAIAELISIVSRVEMGINSISQSNGMNSVIQGFDTLNSNILETRNAQDKLAHELGNRLENTFRDISSANLNLSNNILNSQNDICKSQTTSIISELNQALEQQYAKIKLDLKSTIDETSIHILNELASNDSEFISSNEKISGEINTLISITNDLSTSKDLEELKKFVDQNTNNIQHSLKDANTEILLTQNGIVQNLKELTAYAGNLSSAVQIEDLNASIKLLHQEIRSELQQLADMPIQVDLGELVNVPNSLEKLSHNFQSRFTKFEDKILNEYPSIMEAILKQEKNASNLDSTLKRELSFVRQELLSLKETLKNASLTQNDHGHLVKNATQLSFSIKQNLPEVGPNLINSLSEPIIKNEAHTEEALQKSNAAVKSDVNEIPLINQNISNQSNSTNIIQQKDESSRTLVNMQEKVVFVDEMPKKQHVETDINNFEIEYVEPQQNLSPIEVALSRHISQKYETSDLDENLIHDNQAELEKKQDLNKHGLVDLIEKKFELGSDYFVHQHEQKQDFIAAARKAAQSAALEANIASLTTRQSKIEPDPFEETTTSTPKISILEAGKSILSKIRLGSGPKAEKSTFNNSSKISASEYVAPALAAHSAYVENEDLLEPDTEKTGSLKKTMMMSASAALIAAGTFGYLTTDESNKSNIAEVDVWNGDETTASLPEPHLKKDDTANITQLPPIENQAEIKKIFEQNNSDTMIDGVPNYQNTPKLNEFPVKSYDHLDQAKLEYMPYEMIAGVPVPPMIVGQKASSVNTAERIQNAHSLQQTAYMQFKMPLESIGSEKLRISAAQGNPAAMLEIANRYVEGRGVARDASEAIIWFQRAADAGSAPAQYRLGSFYEKGYGVSKDVKKAATFYEKSAIVGNRKAMHNLAVLYAEGVNGKPNFELSLKWFREAADRGLPDSQFNLGVVYARGLGVKQDLVESYKWFAIAAEAGDKEAIKKRDEVAAKMDPKMVHWAKSAVRLFQPKELDSLANDGQMPFETWDEMPAGKLSAVQSFKRVA